MQALCTVARKREDGRYLYEFLAANGDHLQLMLAAPLSVVQGSWHQFGREEIASPTAPAGSTLPLLAIQLGGTVADTPLAMPPADGEES